jgi:S1-C subfamily serine protease
MYRLLSAVPAFVVAILLCTRTAQAPNVVATAPLPEPVVTLLNLHPIEPGALPDAQSLATSMPKVVRQGEASTPDSRQVQVPAVASVAPGNASDPEGVVGKTGTGFFVSGDGTLLTAAHVVNECRRMQVISKYVPRTWVSLIASDRVHDIAVLKAAELRPPSIARIAAGGPVSSKLFILGYPASAGLTVAAATWGVTQNQKFPANVGPLANPRELLWMQAADVTNGYSGGPIFDPQLGAVVGIVKGEVDGGYLRLVRDMPTTGIAIGPGTTHIGALLRREVPFAAINLVASSGEGNEESLRRATVHVLCWH